jgi:hypothetical protein
MIKLLIEFFEREGWEIDIDRDHILMLMPSGYGSGPAVVDLTELAEYLQGSRAMTDADAAALNAEAARLLNKHRSNKK